MNEMIRPRFRVGDAVIFFGVDHPELYGVVGRVIDIRPGLTEFNTCYYGIRLNGRNMITEEYNLVRFAPENLTKKLNTTLEKNKMKHRSRSVRTALHNGVNGRLFTIDTVIYSGPKTIILWTDGTKTIASCGGVQTYDPYYGFCAAVTKKIFGSKNQVDKIVRNGLKNAVKAAEKDLTDENCNVIAKVIMEGDNAGAKEYAKKVLGIESLSITEEPKDTKKKED